VRFDKKRKRWFFRCSPVDPTTGLRRERKEFFLTQKEAEQARRRFLSEFERCGEAVFSREDLTFEQLAERYQNARLIPAEYIDGKKVAGHRELSPLTSYLKSLTEYFGKRKIRVIQYGDLEALKLHLIRKPTREGKKRTAAAVHRELQFLRAMLNFALANGWIESNPFSAANGKKLINRSAEKKRERFPTFGEELAMLRLCAGRSRHLRPLLIIAADSGLRRRELLTLQVSDLDFSRRVICLQSVNAKTNVAREVPMTPRVFDQLKALCDGLADDALVFGGLTEFKRAFETLRKNAGIEDLHFHDFRHAFVSRGILAGIPQAMILKASGHSSEEWKRYLNVTPDQLRRLLEPIGEQTAAEVIEYARSVMKGLREAMRYDEIEKLFEL
jgi:integrase